MNVLLFLSLVAFTPPQPSYKAERIVFYLTAITDIATTRVAIINGGKEGNRLLAPFIGKTPSTLKLIGAKAISILLTELAVKHYRGKKNYKLAKFLLEWSAYLWGLASGSNLRFAFK